MGQKTHPLGFRLGINADWKTHWFAGKSWEYRALVIQDLQIRQKIQDFYKEFSDSGISSINIDRQSEEIVVTIFSSRPGILIGRDGERIKKLKASVEKEINLKFQFNISEIAQPELDAYLVASSIAEQLERRISHRRAMRNTAQRTMQSGALGIKVLCKGRLMGVEIARQEKVMMGRLPLHTLRAQIDFSIAEASTLMGKIGVKVWIYKKETIVEKIQEEDNSVLDISAMSSTLDEEGVIDASAK